VTATAAPVDRNMAHLQAAQIRLVQSSALYAQGHFSEAVTAAEAVLDQPDLADELYASAERARMLALTEQADNHMAEVRARAILAGEGRGGGTDVALSAALTTFGVMAWDEGRVGDGLGLMRAAIGRAARAPTETQRTHPQLNLALWLTAIGELDEASAVVDAISDEIIREADQQWAAAPAVATGRLHHAAGRMDDAVDTAELALSISENTGTRIFVPMAEATLGSVAMLRGDLRQATTHAIRGQAALPTSRSTSTELGWLQLKLREAEHGAEGVLSTSVFDEMPRHPRVLVEEPGGAAWLVRVALAADEPRRADTVVICSEHLAAINPGFSALEGAAEHARALRDHNVDGLERAAASCTHPFARGSALEDAAGVLLTEWRNAEAADLLGEAFSAYTRAGAQRDATRVGRRMKRAEDPGHRRPMSGWASLTPVEGAIADLVTEGLTNPQVGARMFISRHTVDFHLRQIFRKLDVHSRVELTRMALQRNTSPRGG
jgi:DNA-binding CsgD family transcriptional regulator/tetratricopeptide (TPR) repeat protein